MAWKTPTLSPTRSTLIKLERKSSRRPFRTILFLLFTLLKLKRGIGSDLSRKRVKGRKKIVSSPSFRRWNVENWQIFEFHFTTFTQARKRLSTYAEILETFVNKDAIKVDSGGVWTYLSQKHVEMIFFHFVISPRFRKTFLISPRSGAHKIKRYL